MWSNKMITLNVQFELSWVAESLWWSNYAEYSKNLNYPVTVQTVIAMETMPRRASFLKGLPKNVLNHCTLM
jgi:hypothetical protein